MTEKTKSAPAITMHRKVSVGGVFLRLVQCVLRADQAYRDKQKLKSMDAEHLADMGIKRDAIDEAFYQGRRAGH